MPCACALLAYMGLIIPDGLPRTLSVEIDDWKNQSWGFHAVERRRIRCKIAISANGSRMNRCETESFRHFFIPEEHSSEHAIYLRPQNSAYRIDDESRSVRGGPCGCTWETFQLDVADPDCMRTAQARLSDSHRVGSGSVAGKPVIRYRAEDARGTVRELSLAPDLACEVMEEVHWWKGTLGIPAAKWGYVVTNYRPGEPDRRLFQLPAGYDLRK
jgi:hypothetical protein